MLPVVGSFLGWEESGVVKEEHLVAKTQPVVFHEQLKRERELRGWAQAYLATRLGVAPRIVDLWERGEAFPDPTYLNALSMIFGKNLEELGLLEQQNSEEVKLESSAPSPDTDINGPVTDVSQEKDHAESGLWLDYVQRQVIIDGKVVQKPVSVKEFKLLEFLAMHAGKVCSREETSEAVYNEVYVPSRDTARLDALIERTRQHIGDDQRNPRFIETVRGVGYRLHGYVGQQNSEETNGDVGDITTIRDGRTRVLVMYSLNDKEYFRQLQTHLARYEREKLLDVWDDTKITAGSGSYTVLQELQKALATVKVVILLVSTHFLASSFIDHSILSPLLRVVEADGAIVLPIIISHGTSGTSLQRFQPFNDPSVPLTSMRSDYRQNVWADLARYIIRATASK
jgi:DNA-binding winged helix-turn-helix (wHTH) protein/DNA-binding transcriptional regulator YiaG